MGSQRGALGITVARRPNFRLPPFPACSIHERTHFADPLPGLFYFSGRPIQRATKTQRRQGERKFLRTANKTGKGMNNKCLKIDQPQTHQAHQPN